MSLPGTLSDAPPPAQVGRGLLAAAAQLPPRIGRHATGSAPSPLPRGGRAGGRRAADLPQRHAARGSSSILVSIAPCVPPPPPADRLPAARRYGWGRNADKLVLPEGVGFSVGGATSIKWIVAQVGGRARSPRSANQTGRRAGGRTAQARAAAASAQDSATRLRCMHACVLEAAR